MFSKKSREKHNIRFVKGQELAKRALEVACVGGHSLLILGCPGNGKTMLAKSVYSIMPEGDLSSNIQFSENLHWFDDNLLLNMQKEISSNRKTPLMRIATTWPCYCGYYGDPVRECICSVEEITHCVNKLNKVNGVFGMKVEAPRVPYEKIRGGGREGEDYTVILKRITDAHERQLKRQKTFNAWLNPDQIHRYCVMPDESEALLKRAVDSLGIGFRGYVQCLLISRSIADLHGRDKIETADIAEAIQYRGEWDR